ncbi:MAG TPA: NAD(P)H-hydrate dehydratase [Nitrospiria bacterium]|nr:NAD(P)H-hydrate dehydratase [Nitrospiria bacterium]
MKVVTAKQMRELDRLATDQYHIPAAQLMERAGERLLAAVRSHLDTLAGKRIVIAAGKGNNGGDGLVLARLLRQHPCTVETYLAIDETALGGLTKDQCQRLRQAGGRIAERAGWTIDQFRKAAAGADLVVDALLGTGLTKPVEGLYADLITAINDAGAPVLAVDLPSGLNADTGAVMGTAVTAALTVTFALPKLGLLLHPGAARAGRVIVADIGIPQAAIDRLALTVEQITPDMVRRAMKPRAPQQHKGDFGHLLVIAGSEGKMGAAAMCALGALRAGVGLVTVAGPRSQNPIIQTLAMEAMSAPLPETEVHTLAEGALPDLLRLAAGKRAVALGPGLSLHPDTQALIRALAPQLSSPLVIDADGLNAIAGHDTATTSRQAPTVLTPHPGEMARLLDCTADRVEEDRPAAAREAARRYRAWVVLKGAHTLLADPNGRLWINTTGNPGMATGGTGDVLTGVLGALLAQAIPLPDAATAAIYLHGLAGDLAARRVGEMSLIAGDLLTFLPAAFRHAYAEST